MSENWMFIWINLLQIWKGIYSNEKFSIANEYQCLTALDLIGPQSVPADPM